MSTHALIDFHCHLDLYPDHVQAIADCERERVFTLAVTTTPKAWTRNHELTKDTKYVRAALGLHPQLVGQRAQEIGLWEELLPQTRYVGEVGLDAGPRFYRSFEAQKAVFERVLTACARGRQGAHHTQHPRRQDRSRHARTASSGAARHGGDALVHGLAIRGATRRRSRLLLLGQSRNAREHEACGTGANPPARSTSHRDRRPLHEA